MMHTLHASVHDTSVVLNGSAPQSWTAVLQQVARGNGPQQHDGPYGGNSAPPCGSKVALTSCRLMPASLTASFFQRLPAGRKIALTTLPSKSLPLRFSYAFAADVIISYFTKQTPVTSSTSNLGYLIHQTSANRRVGDVTVEWGGKKVGIRTPGECKSAL